MAFRDTFDQCPRCGTTLEDAHSARGCRSCGGAFVEAPVLAEMFLEMLPPPPRAFGQLALSEVKRGEKLACPSCGEPMTPTTIHEVELDHCKKHGVWFDPDELRVTLYRVGRDGPPAFKEWEPIAPRFDLPQPPPRPLGVPPVAATAKGVTFRVDEPGGNTREITLDQTVIKIGKLARSHIRIEHDESVSRLHAVVEVEGDKITIIDLGSSLGTLVNDQKVNKATLGVGDVIRVGAAQITILSRVP